MIILSFLKTFFVDYLMPVITGFIITLGNLFCPIVVLPMVLFYVKWDNEPSTDSKGVGMVIRGDLDERLSYFSTPDERLPGGLYEDTVLSMYNKLTLKFNEKTARLITSWYWLGARNPLMGMANSLGKTVSGFILDGPKMFYKAEGVWRLRVPLIPPFVFLTGYEIYFKLDKVHTAAPIFTIKRDGPVNPLPGFLIIIGVIVTLYKYDETFPLITNFFSSVFS